MSARHPLKRLSDEAIEQLCELAAIFESPCDACDLAEFVLRSLYCDSRPQDFERALAPYIDVLRDLETPFFVHPLDQACGSSIEAVAMLKACLFEDLMRLLPHGCNATHLLPTKVVPPSTKIHIGNFYYSDNEESEWLKLADKQGLSFEEVRTQKAALLLREVDKQYCAEHHNFWCLIPDHWEAVRQRFREYPDRRSLSKLNLQIENATRKALRQLQESHAIPNVRQLTDSSPTPDNVASRSAESSDESQKKSLPRSPEVLALIRKLRDEAGNDKSEAQIARDFVGARDPMGRKYAANLLRSARNHCHLWK